MATSIDPQRTIRDLQDLRSLTGDADGAQRVAFTPTWLTARAWFREQLAGLPVEVHADAAGNVWTTLPGTSDRAVVIGSHIDSVPNGGWLDGCLGLLAGLEVLRRVAAEYAGTPPVTLRVVDWADEEGARELEAEGDFIGGRGGGLGGAEDGGGGEGGGGREGEETGEVHGM
jgi:N-carbamoyl-L-amino-acid hydrolase